MTDLMKNTYWNYNGTFQDKVADLEDLIPMSGPTATMQGELFRAASKIYHDFYNNGFGNTWTGPAAFLMDHVDLDATVKELFLDYGAGNINGAADADVPTIELMMDTVVGYVTENSADLQDASVDMWDYDDSDYDFVPEDDGYDTLYDEEDEYEYC